MKTLPAAALGAGLLLLSLAAPVLAQQAKPAPQPAAPVSAAPKAPAAKVRGDGHERNERHEQRSGKHDEKREREHDPKHDPKPEKEGRHDRD